jgi:undecaprenyl-diphosphatase
MIIQLWQAIFLGVVQGLTEFLPVSSSGHLIIASQLSGAPLNFTNDVLLNIGTLVAIAIYFKKDILSVLKSLFNFKNKTKLSSYWQKILVSTLPALIIGYFFSNQIEEYLHGINTVIIMLALVGVAMIKIKPKIESTDNFKDDSKNILDSFSLKHASIIGLMQSVALISGTSRSGITILTALALGYGLKQSAKFSFIIGLPVISAATLKVLLSTEGLNFIQTQSWQFILGNLASLVAGLLAVKWLIKIITKNGLKSFGIYRLYLAAVIFILT